MQIRQAGWMSVALGISSSLSSVCHDWVVILALNEDFSRFCTRTYTHIYSGALVRSIWVVAADTVTQSARCRLPFSSTRHIPVRSYRSWLRILCCWHRAVGVHHLLGPKFKYFGLYLKQEYSSYQLLAKWSRCTVWMTPSPMYFLFFLVIINFGLFCKHCSTKWMHRPVRLYAASGPSLSLNNKSVCCFIPATKLQWPYVMSALHH